MPPASELLLSFKIKLNGIPKRIAERLQILIHHFSVGESEPYAGIPFERCRKSYQFLRPPNVILISQYNNLTITQSDSTVKIGRRPTVLGVDVNADWKRR